MNPKVNFKIGSLEDNICIVTNFYDNLEDKIKELYPGINKDNIDKVVTRVYNKEKANYIKRAEEYSKLWDKYSDKYFNFIRNYLNIGDISDVTAFIILIPIFPRNLSNNTFYISPNLSDDFALNIIKHEITHFYWFKKFNEVYPKIDKKEYNIPYKPWVYSEMVIDPILNQKAYDEYYVLKYDGKYIMKELRNIYKEDISIEDKIKKGYEYISKAL